MFFPWDGKEQQIPIQIEGFMLLPCEKHIEDM